MPASKCNKPCEPGLAQPCHPTCRWRDATDEEWATPSLAVVACRGGHGVVLWYGGGPSLAFEIEEGGIAGLDDLGLDDAPEGISIWTGRYVTKGGPSIPGYCDDSIETTPKGSFRQHPWPRLRCSKCGGEASRPGPVLDGSDANLCERCEHAVYCCCDDGSPGDWEGCLQDCAIHGGKS